MKKGKWATLSAVVGTAVPLLSACGPGDDNSSGTQPASTGTKTLLVWEDVKKSDGIQDAVKEFEKQNDVKVKVVEKAYADQIEALRLDGATGTGQMSSPCLTTKLDQLSQRDCYKKSNQMKK